MAVRLLEKLLTFLFDILAVNVAFIAAFWLRYKSNLFPEAFNPNLDLANYLTPAMIFSAMWAFLFFVTGLYRDWYKESRLDELFVVSRTVFTGMFLLFLVTSAPEIINFVTNRRHLGSLYQNQIRGSFYLWPEHAFLCGG